MFVWRDCSWRTCKTSSQLLFVCKVFFPSCRDIGEMQWNRCYPCHHDIELAIIHSILARSSSFLPSLCLCTFAFCSISIATMFAHLCLQLRSSTASWCRASFVSQRSLCGNASDSLSLSLYLFPLFLSVVPRHMSSDALYPIFSSRSILLFYIMSFHSSFKIHQ